MPANRGQELPAYCSASLDNFGSAVRVIQDKHAGSVCCLSVAVEILTSGLGQQFRGLAPFRIVISCASLETFCEEWHSVRIHWKPAGLVD